MVRLKLFGSASLEGPDGPLGGRAAQRHRLALLALLALARQRGLTRDKLIGYLWPDAGPERGRRFLSDSVYRVNQAVAVEAVVAIGDGLRLDPALLPSDAEEFADALDRGDWQRAAALHVAPFLDGFTVPGADELERWVEAQRERLARDRSRALELLAEGAERDGVTGDAVHWWRVLAAHDPYSSRIALRLMRVLDRSGDAAAALRHAAAHAHLLAEELALEADGELLSFVEELRGRTRASGPASGEQSPRGELGREAAAPAASSAPDAASAAPGTSAPPAPRSVAVLPFASLGPETANDYFADGITEDTIAQLSKIGALTVLARASSMRFKGRGESLQAIGRTLGVANLLTGSVRRLGNRVRIVAELIDTATEECLWAETYDRQLTDVFAIQSDVALHIAAALHAHLSPEEKSRLQKEPTRDLEAYQLYLQGRHWFAAFTTEGMRKAIAYFERALALDPDYALACAGIAMVYAELGENGWLEPEDAYRRARAAATRALALDDTLAEAHAVVGQLAAVEDFDWATAEREFKRALELSPSSADAFDVWGRICSSLGRFEEAVGLEKRAQELDPIAHRTDFATALLRAGRWGEAIAAAKLAVEFDPQHDRAHATLGWAFLKAGRTGEGLAELEQAVSLAPTNTAWLAQLGCACALAGQVERARDILRQLEELALHRYVSPYHLAYLFTGLGEQDRALDALEQSYRERAGSVYGIKGSFLFTSLHAQPRFTALLRRMRLA